jgi:hypothetical protein
LMVLALAGDSTTTTFMKTGTGWREKALDQRRAKVGAALGPVNRGIMGCSY